MRSILKPEVELMVFLRMRSDKITKNGENALKMQFQSPISMFVYVFRYEESEFGVHFETGSRNNGVSAHAQNKKIHDKRRKMPLKSSLKA